MSIIISIASLLISLSTYIYNALSKRKKISLSILEYSHACNESQFFLAIENCSHLPVSISRIFINVDNTLYECKRIPTTVRTIERSNRGSVTIEEIKTLPFPIALNSLGGLNGYVVFPKSPKISENQDTLVNFQLYTNRGKIKSLKVPLESTCRQRTS